MTTTHAPPFISSTTSSEDDHPIDIDITTLTPTEKKALAISDAESITSDTATTAPTSTLNTSTPSSSTFTPTKSLHINTKGIPFLRLPLPIKELETTIHNADGSVAYTSTRESKRSGNCVLTDTNGTPCVATEYFFGPGQDPVLKVLNGSEAAGQIGNGTGSGASAGASANVEIKTTSKWTSRHHEFRLPDGQTTMKWAYKKETGFGDRGDKGKALVLEVEGKRAAVLVRNEESRAEGSGKMSAGHGGELMLGEAVVGGGSVGGRNVDGGPVGGGGKGAVSEELVVASCLLMLQKEISRRKTAQRLAMLGAASSG